MIPEQLSSDFLEIRAYALILRIVCQAKGDSTMSADTTRKFHARKRSIARLARASLPLAAIVLVASAVAFKTRAEELLPMHAESLQLGDINGVAYYTVQGPGYHLIATLAGEGGTPVRYESTLLPGQKVVVSIPGVVDAKNRTVEFLRDGDHLLVESEPVQAE
jgi:hypothetical protein